MFSLDAALEGVLNKKSNFDESVDVAVHFCSPESATKVQCAFRHAFTFGKVLVFCPDKSVLPDFGTTVLAGGEDLVEVIKSKKSILKECRLSLATPSMMPKLTKIARILGPRGLMPDSKYGMVSDDIASILESVMRCKLLYKPNKSGVMHAKIGTIGMGLSTLKENFSDFFESLLSARTKASSLHSYVRSISLSSTMGSGFFVDLGKL